MNSRSAPGISKKILKQMARENAKRPHCLMPVPREHWPRALENMIEVWLSRKYLVQVFSCGDILRVSINRTTMNSDGSWQENLTWDEMQSIKRQIGRADSYAVEVLPRDADIVNVANMRHMWILPKPLEIGWFKS